MAFFPRFVQNEFAPMFRFIDACDVATQHPGTQFRVSTPRRAFRPSFDIKESTSSYELQGELPGIDSSDVEIEWTDTNTLSVKGRSVRASEKDTFSSSDSVDAQAERDHDTNDGEQSGYHSASVEDESSAADLTPDTTPTESLKTTVTRAEEQTENSRWWLSERSVGEFARSFTFPLRIDQDSVKASMDKGILRILVPKSQAPVSKRIEIQ